MTGRTVDRRLREHGHTSKPNLTLVTSTGCAAIGKFR
jgi:hypothetical protein